MAKTCEGWHSSTSDMFQLFGKRRPAASEIIRIAQQFPSAPVYAGGWNRRAVIASAKGAAEKIADRWCQRSRKCVKGRCRKRAVKIKILTEESVQLMTGTYYLIVIQIVRIKCGCSRVRRGPATRRKATRRRITRRR